MSADRTFVDTNVLTYLFDDAEPRKQRAATRRLEIEQQARELVLSTQVLQELYVSLTKGKSPIATPEIAEAAVQQAAGGYTIVQVDVPLVVSAIVACRRNRVSFWDALILCAASVAGCDRLLSEDLNPGQTVDGVAIENPFA
jgi:predicted nucleic acid-binding protein